MDYQIEHKVDKSIFRTKIDGQIAFMKYVRNGDIIDFVSTHVPSALENRGLGKALVRAGLEYAIEQELEVRASCSFVEAFLKRHAEEYAGLIRQK